MLIFDTLAFAKRLARTGQSIEVTGALAIALHDQLLNSASAEPSVATAKGITAQRKLARAGHRHAA